MSQGDVIAITFQQNSYKFLGRHLLISIDEDFGLFLSKVSNDSVEDFRGRCERLAQQLGVAESALLVGNSWRPRIDVRSTTLPGSIEPGPLDSVGILIGEDSVLGSARRYVSEELSEAEAKELYEPFEGGAHNVLIGQGIVRARGLRYLGIESFRDQLLGTIVGDDDVPWYAWADPIVAGVSVRVFLTWLLEGETNGSSRFPSTPSSLSPLGRRLCKAKLDSLLDLGSR